MVNQIGGFGKKKIENSSLKRRRVRKEPYFLADLERAVQVALRCKFKGPKS